LKITLNYGKINYVLLKESEKFGDL